jgi:hypothetical protein
MSTLITFRFARGVYPIMSVRATASHTRAPEGRPIIAAPSN